MGKKKIMKQILDMFFTLRLFSSWEEFYETNPFEVNISDKIYDMKLSYKNTNISISNCYFQVFSEESSYGGAIRVLFQSSESNILIEFTVFNKCNCFGIGGGSIFIGGGDSCIINKCCSYGSSISYPFIDENLFFENSLNPHSSFCYIKIKTFI